jgi:hypothetical protein
MQLSHAAGFQAHVDARHGFRDFELPLGDLPRPSTVACFHMGIGEREAQVRHRTMVGCRRTKDIGVLALTRWIAWSKDRGILVLPLCC